VERDEAGLSSGLFACYYLAPTVFVGDNWRVQGCWHIASSQQGRSASLQGLSASMVIPRRSCRFATVRP
jgi:hypothetical protein